MLQLLATLAVGAVILDEIMNDGEKKKRKKYKKKLTKQKSNYEDVIYKREQYNENKKRAILFGEIKREQKELKYERRKLFSLRDKSIKGSPMYKKINENIRRVSRQIEQKQRDADSVRF